MERVKTSHSNVEYSHFELNSGQHSISAVKP